MSSASEKKDFYIKSALSLFLIVVLFDQGTKILVEQNFYLHEVRTVIPKIFNLTLVYNPGVAFGMGANLDSGLRVTFLVAAVAIALLVLLYLFVKDYRGDKLGQMYIAGIVGGAVGNIIDRLRIGKVVDFLDFYWADYHWPAFNVADSCICIAVFLLVFRKPGKGLAGH